MRYSFDFDKQQMNKNNYTSLKGISQQTYHKKQNNVSGQIISQSKTSNESNSTQVFNTYYSKQDTNLKTDSCLNTQISLKQAYKEQLQQSPYNLNEDSLLDQEEMQVILTHTLKTKRNSLITDKENLNFMKQNSDVINWKEKCQELQETLSEKNQKQFVQEKQISQLQTQLVNERNKCRFYEKNQYLFQNIQQQLEESHNQRKLIEDQLLQLIQQNEQLKKESFEIKQIKNNQTTFSMLKGSQSTRNATQLNNNPSLKMKSPDNKYFLSKRTTNDRQSLSNLVQKKSTDEQQNISVFNNEIQIYIEQNKSLQIKVSELQKQVNELLIQKQTQEQIVYQLKIENSELSRKLMEQADTLNSTGFFQFDKSIQKTKNNIQMNTNQHKKSNTLNQNNTQNSLTYNKILSEQQAQKIDDGESISDISYTHQLSNLSQQIFIPEMNYQFNQVKEQAELRDKAQMQSSTQANTYRYSQYKERTIDYNNPCIDEIKFVQQDNSNNNRLSRLCSC